MKIKNILIVGGNGELGFNFTKYYNQKFNIFILDKKISKKKYQNVRYIKCDLLKNNKLKNLPKRIDVVLFFVGILGGPFSLNIDSFNEYFKFNCKTLINFLQIIKNHKMKKLIFTSTEHVYGDNDKAQYNNMLLESNPKNYYGVSKLIAEKILYSHFKKNQISIDILRFPRVISENSKNFIYNFIIDILKKKKVSIDNPKNKFNLIFIKDLLSALVSSVSTSENKFRIFNIFNNSKAISLGKIMKVLRNDLKINFKIKTLSKNARKNHNPQNLKITNNYSKKELNWKPKLSNLQIIKKIISLDEFK